jgi:multidrug transporter EmrE-like cation transporter
MNQGRELVGSVVGDLAAPVPLAISSAAVVGLVLANQIFNVGATMGFALSGRAQSAGLFVLWQAVGSAFGLGSQITFAGLVRFLSLRVANAIGIGLAFVSAQVFGAFVLFREPFAPAQWFGTALVFAGIVFIALGR